MNGSKPDFQEIHNQFRPRVQRYLARLVGEFEAEDLTQEVFVRVSRGLPAFRGESKLSTWIYRIATNAALDRLRTPSFHRIAPDDRPDPVGQEDTDPGELCAQDAAPSIEEQLCRSERFECYQGFIGNLPLNYRVVIALSELDDLPAGEIASVLGLSLETVKIRLHRGRTRLLAELKAHCNPEDWL
jgi:RNA polymerase sigma-70 factor, ECF subfamily